MIKRPRILRKSSTVRSIVRENQITKEDFIIPIFIEEGKGIQSPIASMPGYFRFSLDMAKREVKAFADRGMRSFLLFAKCADSKKDNFGKEAVNPNGLMQTAIREFKNLLPEMCLLTDVALDPYSIYGHDGIVENEQIVNDATVERLAEMAVSHAEAGVDMVAPSDMMDGRVVAIRQALENYQFSNVGIMSYAAKYASCFYGPFRDALDSAPGFGDKKTYQMDPANQREALKEAQLDEQEGADILMVKPALPYLDIIQSVKKQSHLPISAYQVSGEYAMIKLAAQQGIIEETAAIVETLLAIKRAGADLIVSYFVKDICHLLSENS